jgi:outer membrane lipoprotein
MPEWKGCRIAAAVLFLVGLAGCAYPISKQWRQQARKDLTFATVLEDPAPHIGAIVIWGGLIIRTENAPNRSDIFVLETPLDMMGLPGEAESSEGRFIARSSTFLDPAIFAPQRKVIVAGEIVKKDVRPIGRLNYVYPVIAIKQIYLWPQTTIQYYEPPDYYPEDWDWTVGGPYLFYRDFEPEPERPPPPPLGGSKGGPP